MYGRFTEHKFNSLSPKLTTKAAQCICKARSRFLSVPRLNQKISLTRLFSEIPQPDCRIKPKTQSCRSFRAFVFVSRRLLSAKILIGILECILYRPAVVVTFEHLGGTHRQNRRKKNVVFSLAQRVSADNQKYRLLCVPGPTFLSEPNKHFYTSC